MLINCSSLLMMIISSRVIVSCKMVTRIFFRKITCLILEVKIKRLSKLIIRRSRMRLILKVKIKRLTKLIIRRNRMRLISSK